MAKLSAVIITKNEERNIRRCLDAIVEVVDEIVVVDSHSDDGTRSICEGYDGLRFVEHDWMGFSDTKDYAMSLASNEFVLSLDADEEVTEELREEIRMLKPELQKDRAYYLNRITNYCGKWIRHSTWHPDYQMRLFPKSQARWNGAPVHESIKLDDDVETERLEGLLNHYSYFSVDDHLKRAQRYTDLAAEMLAKRQERFLLPKAILNPAFGFLRNYLLKLGFLDGYYGLVIAIVGGYVVFLKYKKAFRLRRLAENSSEAG